MTGEDALTRWSLTEPGSHSGSEGPLRSPGCSLLLGSGLLGLLGGDGLVQPALVIQRPLAGLTEDTVGLANLLELPQVEGLGVLVSRDVSVRVVGQRGPPVGSSDLLSSGLSAHTQHSVQILR